MSDKAERNGYSMIYTATPEQAAPTVEQRLADAEAAICALMGF